MAERTSRWRRALGLLGLALLLALATLTVYLVYLDRTITATFEGRRWTEPAVIYARPLELYPGAALTAAEVIAELDGGTDFAELAASRSIGPSAERGGDLGFFGEGAMVEPFSNAAFALETGSYSKEPVETQFGWHVILVEEERDAEPAPLANVEPELRQQEAGVIYGELMERLRAEAEIEINGTVFEEPVAAPDLSEPPAEEASSETPAP